MKTQNPYKMIGINRFSAACIMAETLFKSDRIKTGRYNQLIVNIVKVEELILFRNYCESIQVNFEETRIKNLECVRVIVWNDELSQKQLKINEYE